MFEDAPKYSIKSMCGARPHDYRVDIHSCNFADFNMDIYNRSWYAQSCCIFPLPEVGIVTADSNGYIVTADSNGYIVPVTD
jgi:hypothetical protein